MRRVRPVLLLPLLAVALLLPSLAYAQVGSIAGLVRDSSGGALPGVTVEVTSPALIEKVRSTTTDGTGRYQITALPVGTYAITFRLEGFSVVRRENVNVTSDFAAPVNVQMAVGNITQTVNVVAEAPVVDVLNARVQQVFQGDEVAALPTQRDISSLLLLVPAITNNPIGGVCNGGVGVFCNPTGPAFNSHTSALDADGQNQGRIMVDGIVINRGGSAAGFSINANTGVANGIVVDTASAQEVSFTLSGALGESETGGSSINIVPRTGGNRYAGSYFTSYTRQQFFGRNRDTRLTNTPAGVQAYVKDYDVNGSFGGPVKRDRLWFYMLGRKRGNENYPNAGGEPGFLNLNAGKFAANYIPDRAAGWQTYSNEYKNAAVRITLQATQRDKLNLYWDEQDACTNPCHGMINIVDSPESYFTLQNRPNRLMQISWTNPYTNRILFDAGLSVIPTHQDSTKHRDYGNIRQIPRVCEAGSTVGLDDVSPKVNNTVTNTANGAGTCSVFNTLVSGSINDAFPGLVPNTLTNDDTYRSKASASYITGSHNAKVGWEGAYFSEKIRNEVNDSRMSYHYATPPDTCAAQFDPVTNPYSCGNMSLYYAAIDPYNLTYRRPVPIGFDYNTGVATTDERVWFGALYLQDQWTLNRLTINGAIRYDHAESRYGSSCIGPDPYVPVQTDGKNYWCSEPAKGVRYNDITPRWGVAWDVFGTGKTSVKWNMGKYLQAAGFGGVYTDNNDARRSTNQLTRSWTDVNGDRIPQCDLLNPAGQTDPVTGDVCGNIFNANSTTPTNAFQQFGRAPNPSQLFNSNSICGRTERSSALHQAYCDASGQNLMAGWDTRRNEWQFGLGIQHELLPRLSGEVTYNWRKYSHLTATDTLGRGCDYYIAGQPGVTTPYDQCLANLENFSSPNYDFFSLEAPPDPRLPNGGGYLIQGLSNQNVQGALPSSGNVTTIQDALDYKWSGVDTNFVYRGKGGFRVSGGTSTGRSLRNTCATDIDTPNLKGREGNRFGGGCNITNPFQTNIRANASYVIPWVDVLLGAIYQHRPGSAIAANWTYSAANAIWDPASASRATQACDTNGAQPGGAAVGCFFTGFGNPSLAPAAGVNLFDWGENIGESVNLVDLTFTKNVRFANKRVSFGVDVYNLFNSDAATGYQTTYTAFHLPDGSWVEDNPNTPAVETNTWGQINQIVNPRFARLRVDITF